MNNSYSFKISQETNLKIQNFYKYCQVEQTNKNIIFSAKGEFFTIAIYSNLTVVIQGKNATEEYAIWNNTKKIELEHIGSDEVGVGDYFGPIIVVASYVRIEDYEYLEKIGVKDSKQLSDDAILNMAPLIIKRIDYEKTVLNNKKYNEIYNSNTLNLNKIKAYLHNYVLSKLIRKTSFSKDVIVDQFCTPYLYYKYLSDYTKGEIVRNIAFFTKAESKYLAVATASIIARYYFLQEFIKMEKQLKITLPKGASNKVDEVAAILIKTYGEDELKKFAKFNYANTLKAKTILSNKP